MKKLKKKIVFLLFVLCLIKLYDIAGRSLNFSPNLLINSFKEDGGEKSSLGIIGDDVIPIDCRLTKDGLGMLTWDHSTFEDSTYRKVVAMFNDGLTQTNISLELGINKSVVSRAYQEGL